MPEKTTQKQTKIAIAEDHSILRQTMKIMLDKEPNFKVVINAKNGVDLISQLQRKSVDIVILDLEMPVMNGQDALKFINRVYPEVKTLILSMHDGEERVKKYFQLGVKGFLSKTCEFAELKLALKTISEDRVYINNSSTNAVYRKIRTVRKNAKSNSIDEPLTLRETQVLKLVCQQKSHREIATELDLSFRTVENHTLHIRKKTGAINGIGLMVYALKHNIISI